MGVFVNTKQQMQISYVKWHDKNEGFTENSQQMQKFVNKWWSKCQNYMDMW